MVTSKAAISTFQHTHFEVAFRGYLWFCRCWRGSGKGLTVAKGRCHYTINFGIRGALTVSITPSPYLLVCTPSCGSHQQWMFEELKIKYVTSSPWLKATKKSPVLVGAIRKVVPTSKCGHDIHLRRLWCIKDNEFASNALKKWDLW